MCQMAIVQRFPVHYHGADITFWSFGITEFILNYFENRVSLKLVLGGVASVHISLLVMNKLN